MITFPAVLTAPGTTTFTDTDGILISYVSDGDLVALGHHDVERAHAAFVKFDDWAGADINDIQVTWAVLTDPTPREGETCPWWMQWFVDKDAPGAFPVMVIET